MKALRHVCLLLEVAGCFVTGIVWGYCLILVIRGGSYYGPLTGKYDGLVIPAIAWGIPYVLARIGLGEQQVVELNEERRKPLLVSFCSGLIVGILCKPAAYILF